MTKYIIRALLKQQPTDGQYCPFCGRIRPDHTDMCGLKPIDQRAKMNLETWKAFVLAAYPKAQFTEEDGSGKTYGDIGDWTAHTGPDMQADVKGVFVPFSHCIVWNEHQQEFSEYNVE